MWTGTNNVLGTPQNIRTDVFCGQVGCSDVLVQPKPLVGDPSIWANQIETYRGGRATFQTFNLTVRLKLFDAPFKASFY